jgi:polyhydroxyalkanoate synthesis regulator phasin
MVELFEKMMVSGLGALALSKNKAEELLGELREKYRLSEDEGKALLNKLQTMAQQGKDNLAEIAENEVKTAIRAAGLVTRSDYELLEKRVSDLERRMLAMTETDDPEE